MFAAGGEHQQGFGVQGGLGGRIQQQARRRSPSGVQPPGSRVSDGGVDAVFGQQGGNRRQVRGFAGAVDAFRVMKQAMSFSLFAQEYSGALRGCVLPGEGELRAAIAAATKSQRAAIGRNLCRACSMQRGQAGQSARAAGHAGVGVVWGCRFADGRG